ncbi:MAG: mechanosensitive ion channel [Gammaproteobacteria bacterium]|nr:mechanosensitive ion channel [Gammaproteobacteria bacterium]MBT8134775.1 mechanosensitive ion channel [Gammaproteobacteria bacterium]NNJ50389.1 mechanosensitive ion channel [Gammaproteobacteria bacterium]
MQEELETLSKIDIGQLIETYVLPWGINIVMALAIFIIGKFIVGVLTNLAKKLMTKANVDNILVNFIASIIKTVLLLFVVIAALDQLGVDTTSMIALIGAAGLAIGLALQGTLQNLASGVMLIIFRPFSDGDFIEAAGVSGVVEQIGIFSITMRTGDNREIIIPNGEVYGGTITNNSRRDTRRVDMVFGIGYDDDLLKAKEIINRILSEDERILADPAPTVAVGELADSSVNFNVRPWCKTADYWGVYGDIHEKIKLTFDAEGISIPYPQMDIHQDKAA